MKVFAFLNVLIMAAVPSTSHYQINNYSFGSGGTADSHTTTYSLEGTAGQVSGQSGSTTGYQAKPGFIQSQQAHVPKLSAFDNNSGQYYNKLHFTIDNQNNPSDATFLIAVSTDNFVSDTRYVQPDGTLSATLALTDYRTYTAWGGSSGSVMIGLLPNQAYSAKVRATQGKDTESAYGPISTATTAQPSLTFSMSTSLTPNAPFSVSLGSLANSVINTSDSISTSMTTNGASGGNVYITSKNGGLKSVATGNQINAVSNDLSSLTNGFGAQNSSVGQTSGGPYSVASPYNVTGTNVGIVNSTTRSLYTSATPVTAGIGTLVLKAKAAKTDIAATDYQEVLTFVAAGNF